MALEASEASQLQFLYKKALLEVITPERGISGDIIWLPVPAHIPNT